MGLEQVKVSPSAESMGNIGAFTTVVIPTVQPLRGRVQVRLYVPATFTVGMGPLKENPFGPAQRYTTPGVEAVARNVRVPG